jgi:hypothetical protein
MCTVARILDPRGIFQPMNNKGGGAFGSPADNLDPWNLRGQKPPPAPRWASGGSAGTSPLAIARPAMPAGTTSADSLYINGGPSS